MPPEASITRTHLHSKAISTARRTPATLLGTTKQGEYIEEFAFMLDRRRFGVVFPDDELVQ